MKKCVDERTVPSQVSTFEIANKNIVAPFQYISKCYAGASIKGGGQKRRRRGSPHYYLLAP